MAEYEMTLMDRQRVARDTMAFWFDTNGAHYEFRAGQHADFAFWQPPVDFEGDNSRTFSLANSPHDRRLAMIALRVRQTPFKMALKTATRGTKFKVSRPRGSFTLHQDVTRPAVFLAGGNRHYAHSQHPSLGYTETAPTPAISVLFEPCPGRRSLLGRVRRLGDAESVIHADSNGHPP